MINDSVVTQIVKNVNGDVTEDVVRRVFAAYDAILEGAPVGTVVKDPKSGAIACRVSESGVPLWRVTALDGSVWRDVQPQLGWDVIAEPASE
jgi:hypothetical protein